MAEPRIDAAAVTLGQGVNFGERVQIGGIRGPSSSVSIGDHVTIGDDVRILAPDVRIGDWTVIHHHTTIYGYAPVEIGECCWIGQNATLNCTDTLTLENGVTFGAYSSVYTHSSGGDVVQGFKFAHTRPAVLREDSFIAPHCFLAPVEVGARSMLLGGGVLARSIPPDTVWGGNPAADLTRRTGRPYAAMTLDNKFLALLSMLRAFQAQQEGLEVVAMEYDRSVSSYSACGVTVTKGDFAEDGDTSIFDIRDRSYSKLGTPEEVAFMRHLLPHVKFYPRGE